MYHTRVGIPVVVAAIVEGTYSTIDRQSSANADESRSGCGQASGRVLALVAPLLESRNISTSLSKGSK